MASRSSGIATSSSRCMSAVKRAMSLPPDRPAGKVAGVAAEIVRGDLDAAIADRRRPQEVDSEPSEMAEAFLRRGALDRAADQRRGRPGVLMVGTPRPNGQRRSPGRPLAEFDIGRVQGDKLR